MSNWNRSYDQFIKREERKLDEINRAKIFGVNLTKAIEESGMTITEVEKASMIGPRTLYDYMKGTSSPKAYNLHVLAKVLKIDVRGLYPL